MDALRTGAWLGAVRMGVYEGVDMAMVVAAVAGGSVVAVVVASHWVSCWELDLKQNFPLNFHHSMPNRPQVNTPASLKYTLGKRLMCRISNILFSVACKRYKLWKLWCELSSSS